MEELKQVALSEAVLMLNSKDYDELASYIKYLGGMYQREDIDLNFYQYKDNPGLICICDIDGAEIGKIQLIADREV